MATMETLLLCVVLAGGNPSAGMPQSSFAGARPAIQQPSRQQPEIVLLQFSSEACAPCKSMQPIVRQLVESGIPVQNIDIARDPATAARFKIDSVPTFVVVSDREEIARHQGTASFDKLRTLYLGESPHAPTAVDSADRLAARNRAMNPGQNQNKVVAYNTGAREEKSDAISLAMAATVRLKVEDPKGFSFGTGTIIDTSEGEALVLSCGHIFRSSQGKGKITADLFSSGTPETVDGEVITYDLERDVALISIRPTRPVQAAQIAPAGFVLQPQQRVFSIGCDKGKEPKLLESHITAVDKFQRTPNLCVAGMPVDGRSGGGLFSMTDGYLIGVCNAAIPSDQEGLYAGLGSVHGQLDKIGFSQIYSRALPSAEQPSEQLAQVADQGEITTDLPENSEPELQEPKHLLPQLGKTMPGSSPNRVRGTATELEVMDDTEVICIVRSRKNPAAQSQIFVLDNITPEMLEQLSVMGRAAPAERIAMGEKPPVAAPTPNSLRERPPIIRGQSR